MTEHHLFIAEKKQVDLLMDQGYRITGMTDNLTGALVLFENEMEKQVIKLQVALADTRKYLSNILINQQGI